MGKFCGVWGIALLGLLPLENAVTLAGARAEPDKVAVKVIKLDGLKDLIKQHKGKVVVVDFWADT